MEKLIRRQKIILKTILNVKREVKKLELVKYMFLLKNETGFISEHGAYDFVPYKYGPFSFQLYHDLEGLASRGLIELKDHALLLSEYGKAVAAEIELCETEALEIDRILSTYSHLSTDDLLRYVYSRYPWFASKSVMDKNGDFSPRRGVLAVYTVGYEGLSVDEYFARLLRHNIAVLVDVRNNPVSRKYGFSSKRLSTICSHLGLEYYHCAYLGIENSLRSDAKSSGKISDILDWYYDSLDMYKDQVKELTVLFTQRPTALTCFEANPDLCHRGRLAYKVGKILGLEIFHIIE